MAAAPIARRVRITGSVQGVFFRAWAAEQAEAVGVAGWVRNCPDGSVEAWLQGDAGAVAALIAALHRGPPSASVERVEVEESEL
ncbi:MAG: acylphosphatase, partial [Novosphingobium sp.]|nr:acylphosphatase [Novosphingobium sp.]